VGGVRNAVNFLSSGAGQVLGAFTSVNVGNILPSLATGALRETRKSAERKAEKQQLAAMSASYNTFFNTLQGDKNISERTREELSNQLLDLSVRYGSAAGAASDQQFQKITEAYKSAQESLSSGTGGEFSRVKRQQNLAQGQTGRQTTILTGRL
jgi:hypothetical protein